MTHALRFTAKQMANQFKCSKSTIYARSKRENLRFQNHYTEISDIELKKKIEDLHEAHPNSGSVVNM